jgi:hypothetical protein
MKKSNLLLLAIALLVGITGSAVAQEVPVQGGDDSVYFVSYFSNNVAAAPDETVRIIHDGSAVLINQVPTPENLWAAFYVFDDSQELTECCACQITPDGLLSESVKTQLTANTLTGKVPSRGVIKVISSASPDPTNVIPTAGLRAWATHVQGPSKNVYSITETMFADSNLTAGERNLLQNLCYYDALLSGLPCTCTPEDHDF